jgi:hypothetical protein
LLAIGLDSKHSSTIKVSKRYPTLVLMMAIFGLLFLLVGTRRCAIVSEYTVGRKDAAIICRRRGIAQGLCPVSNSFLFWAGEHASSLADLQRRLLWCFLMDCQRPSRCHCHLYCCCCCSSFVVVLVMKGCLVGESCRRKRQN